MAFSFDAFMVLVRQDNPHFKRVAMRSDLDPLIAQLKGKTFISPAHRDTLEEIIAFIPYAKQQKYHRALGYLTQQGQVRVGAIPAKPVMKFTKFLIMKAVYEGWNGQGVKKSGIPLFGRPEDIGVRSYLHRHELTWEASNGHAPSLQTVRTREYVKFLTDPTAPPFNRVQDPDREFYAPGTQGTAGATNGVDDHSTKLPALICAKPRVPGTLIAEQLYQYSTDNGGRWRNIPGAAYLIEKTVRREGADWVYVFKKSNWAPHNTKRFHFEVHYTIGNEPEYMPRVDTDVAMGLTEDADIRTYARKVVARG